MISGVVSCHWWLFWPSIKRASYFGAAGRHNGNHNPKGNDDTVSMPVRGTGGDVHHTPADVRKMVPLSDPGTIRVRSPLSIVGHQWRSMCSTTISVPRWWLT